MVLTDVMQKIAAVDIFKRDPKTKEICTGMFVGRPFAIDYDRAFILIADAWKSKAKGIPQGSFLLAYYENEESVLDAEAGNTPCVGSGAYRMDRGAGGRAAIPAHYAATGYDGGA